MDKHELGPALAPNRLRTWGAYTAAALILVPLLPATRTVLAHGPSVATLGPAVPFVLASIAAALFVRARFGARTHVGPEAVHRTNRRGEVTQTLRYADITSMILTRTNNLDVNERWWTLRLVPAARDDGAGPFRVSTIVVRSLTPLLERLEEEARRRPEILPPHHRALWEQYPR